MEVVKRIYALGIRHTSFPILAAQVRVRRSLHLDKYQLSLFPGGNRAPASQDPCAGSGRCFQQVSLITLAAAEDSLQSPTGS